MSKETSCQMACACEKKHEWNLEKMKKNHKVLAKYSYKRGEIDKGYANKTLYVNLSTLEIKEKKVSEQMKKTFTGGRGFGLKLMWESIKPSTRWDSEENELIITTGPLCGVTQYAGAGKSICLTVSPATNIICDSNVGGFFGPYLKFSGFDALEIQGKANRDDIVVLVDGEKEEIQIVSAPDEDVDTHLVNEQLTYMYAPNDSEKARQQVSVVSSGSAASHTWWGCLNFSLYDAHHRGCRVKQAGRGGLGSVFRNKGLKAIVAVAPMTKPIWNISSGQKLSEDINKDPIDLTAVDKIIEKWDCNKEFVIEMFQDIQDEYQHIPMQALLRVSECTGVPQGQLVHIATFYKSFSLQAQGQFEIQVCMGTACYVRGAGEVIEAFEKELGISRGETTKDGKFTLKEVRCIGCCGLAPAIMINDEVIGKVKPAEVADIIKKYASKKGGA